MINLAIKIINFRKCIERSIRIINNVNFERDQKNFFKKIENGAEHVVQTQWMKKIVKSLGDI